MGIINTVERTDYIAVSYVVVPEYGCLQELLGSVFEY